MERVTFRIPKLYIALLDEDVENGIYPNRSEAIRDRLRDGWDEGAIRRKARELDERVPARVHRG